VPACSPVVHGVEYAYGKHDRPSSGIFEVLPRRCPGYAFREPVLVGTRDLTRAEVCALKAELAKDFTGDAYNLVSRNCNCFCDASSASRPGSTDSAQDQGRLHVVGHPGGRPRTSQNSRGICQKRSARYVSQNQTVDAVPEKCASRYAVKVAAPQHTNVSVR
jgi:hypothetical protein